MKKTILIIVVLILIAGAAFWFYKTRTLKTETMSGATIQNPVLIQDNSAGE